MNFWQVHGLFFLGFMFFFPRLTLLFSSVPFGGFFWWIGWLIAPRLLVAILATHAYWQTNVVLVVFTWIWALSLESGEKKLASRIRSPLGKKKSYRSEVIDVEARRDR